jgi:paraquat-inducible protein A
MLYLAQQVYHQSRLAQHLQYQIAEQVGSRQQVDNAGKRFISWITGNRIGDRKRQHQLKSLTLKLVATERMMHRTSLKLMALSGLVILLGFVWRRRLLELAIAMLVVSLVALALGLSMPVLTIVASQNLPVLGSTVFQYESKGILSAAHTLYARDQVVLAGLLFFFSVVLPVAKTISLIVISVLKDLRFAGLVARVFSTIGKWSMTDVLVVAMLVVFFASSRHSVTEAVVEPGLYFFVAYVLLSLVASVLIERRVRDG